jgi:hypothetical protein
MKPDPGGLRYLKDMLGSRMLSSLWTTRPWLHSSSIAVTNKARSGSRCEAALPLGASVPVVGLPEQPQPTPPTDCPLVSSTQGRGWHERAGQRRWGGPREWCG